MKALALSLAAVLVCGLPLEAQNEREIEQLYYSAQHYVRLKDAYLGMA